MKNYHLGLVPPINTVICGLVIGFKYNLVNCMVYRQYNLLDITMLNISEWSVQKPKQQLGGLTLWKLVIWPWKTDDFVDDLLIKPPNQRKKRYDFEWNMDGLLQVSHVKVDLNGIRGMLCRIWNQLYAIWMYRKVGFLGIPRYKPPWLVRNFHGISQPPTVRGFPSSDTTTLAPGLAQSFEPDDGSRALEAAVQFPPTPWMKSQ